MRKLAYLLLLASVATPSLAQDRNHDRESRRDEARSERSERQEAREDRREERRERAEQQQEPRQQQQVREQREDRQQVRAERRDDRPPVRIERSRDERVSTREARGRDRDTQIDRRAGGDNAAQREERRDARLERRIERHAPPPVSNVPREGTQPPPVAHGGHSSGSKNWNSHWRNDRRYDWNGWRSRHRSLFRLGFYFDPFGWSYRPYQIGWRMLPSYYRSNYWLNDPWMYRLPPAYPGTVWVRYYDDAVLVDTWSGEVVDVIYSFFW